MAIVYDRMILAGMFACSNMGQTVCLSATKVALRYPPKSPRSTAIMFCEQFMETEEHEDIFTEEAKMWHDDMLSEEKTDEEIRRLWPDICNVYAQAWEEVNGL